MIIAEIGLNHLGDPAYLTAYLQILTETNIDAVTLQIREPAFYETNGNEKLSLRLETYREARDLLHRAGMRIGLAICSDDALPLVHEVAPDFLKLLSWAISDEVLVKKLLEETSLPLFFSTGVSSELEIETFFASTLDKADRMTLIHTQLKNDLSAVNLSAIPTLRNRYGIPVAYGHHCLARKVLCMSLCYNPSDIFFYVVADRKTPHPDQEHAVPLHEISSLVNDLIQLEAAIGDGIKRSGTNEIELGWHEKQSR